MLVLTPQILSAFYLLPVLFCSQENTIHYNFYLLSAHFEAQPAFFVHVNTWTSIAFDKSYFILALSFLKVKSPGGM